MQWIKSRGNPYSILKVSDVSYTGKTLSRVVIGFEGSLLFCQNPYWFCKFLWKEKEEKKKSHSFVTITILSPSVLLPLLTALGWDIILL